MIVRCVIGESIRIGERIVVTLKSVGGGRNRAEFHIEAPKETPIRREPNKQEKPR